MAITETLNVTSSTTSLTTSVGATDRELVKLYHVVASPASITLINSALYTITGYSDTSQKLSIVFDDWTDYVGDSILVVIYTDIDTGNVADAMLTSFGTAANISPTTLQNELAHLYYIVGQITDGDAVGTVSLGTVSDVLANVNTIADLIFESPSLDVDSNWDGTDTLSIGGDTTVEGILTTHESRLDTAETEEAALRVLIASAIAGTASTAADVLVADTAGNFSGLQAEAVLAELGLSRKKAWTMANAARLGRTSSVSTTADALCIALYGQYGVVGADGGTDGIWRSSDYGRSWVADTSIDAILTNVNGLAFNSDGTKLVAVGSPVAASEIAYSSDYGNTWTGVATPAATQNTVCHNGTLFVSAGNSGTILTSADGITWTARTAAGTTANITFGGSCWSEENSLFVLVGTDSTGGAHIEIQTSPDGITWTAQSAAATSETVLYEVAEVVLDGTTYTVAVGAGGEIQYSVNCTAWTQHPQSGLSAANMVSIASVPAAAMIGYDNSLAALMTSITRVSEGRPPEDYVAAAFTSSKLLIKYSDEFGIVMAGPNGEIWQSFTGLFI